MRTIAKGFKKAIAMVMILTMVMANVLHVSAVEDDLLPVRVVFEDMLGGTVEWQAEDQSITIDWLGHEIVLFINQSIALVDGREIELLDGVRLVDHVAFMTLNDIIRIELAMAGAEFARLYLTEEARDLVLYDFDYAINFILDNSPWDSVIYRRLGIDFDAYVAGFRESIVNMEPINGVILQEFFPFHEGDDARAMAANYLISLLAFEFALPFGGIGHIGARDLQTYRMQLTLWTRAYHDEDIDDANAAHIRQILDVFASPQAIWFYGEYEIDLTEEDHPMPDIEGNIEVEILIPGEVAFLRINTFMANPEFDDNTILPFLQEIADFDHLILDVRGNGGGLAIYFDHYIVSRLINEPLEFSSWQFFRAGDAAMAHVNTVIDIYEYFLETDETYDEIFYFSIVPAADFIAERGMTEFHPEDLARLDYVFYTRSAIFPAEDSVGFDGEVWLLIDGGSASASVLAAQRVLAMDGTLVGTPTSGVMGAMHLYTALPNTGIIWRVDHGFIPDELGRSLEVYGIMPHHFNAQGFDAVQTALALIAGEELTIETYLDSALIGAWAWVDALDYVYTFYADGTGARGFVDERYDFTWETYNGNIWMNLGEGVGSDIINPQHWAYVIIDDMLVLESMQVEDLMFAYIQLPEDWEDLLDFLYIPVEFLGSWKCLDDTIEHSWFCSLEFFADGSFMDGDGDWGYFYVYENMLFFDFDDFDPIVLYFFIDGDTLLLNYTDDFDGYVLSVLTRQ
ncbi:MAG: S41 family peptidase [Defluviitaleaceae bacterium]|nr:S41 family peptidase [Defluviitaleaceae bacterium]